MNVGPTGVVIIPAWWGGVSSPMLAPPPFREVVPGFVDFGVAVPRSMPAGW